MKFPLGVTFHRSPLAPMTTMRLRRARPELVHRQRSRTCETEAETQPEYGEGVTRAMDARNIWLRSMMETAKHRVNPSILYLVGCYNARRLDGSLIRPFSRYNCSSNFVAAAVLPRLWRHTVGHQVLSAEGRAPCIYAASASANVISLVDSEAPIASRSIH